MGKICRVDISPNRAYYDELRLKGYKIKEIWRIAKTEFKEDIPIHSFYYHFRHHLERIIKEGEKASKLRQDAIEEEIYKSMDAARMLRTNLERCAEQSGVLTDISNPKERKEMRSIISISNETIGLILRFLDKLEVKSKLTEEDIFKKVIQCIKDFPPELILEFTKKWKEYKYE